MKGLLIAHSLTGTIGGGKTIIQETSKTSPVDICILPKADGKEFPLGIPTITEPDFSDYDYVLFADTYGSHLPLSIFEKIKCPIAARVYEGHGLRKSHTFWKAYSDGLFSLSLLIVSTDALGRMAQQKYGIQTFQMMEPYKRRDISNGFDSEKENVVLSFGRIVKEKAHLELAQLWERVGGEIWIAGQRVNIWSMGEYYNLLKQYPVRIFPNPKEEKKTELYSKAKVIFNCYAVPEVECSPQYVCMEAMNHYCVPVLPEYMRKYYVESGFLALFFEHFSDIPDLVNAIFQSETLRQHIIYHNYEALEKRMVLYQQQWESMERRLVE